MQIPALQDEIAADIARQVQGELLRQRGPSANRKPGPGNNESLQRPPERPFFLGKRTEAGFRMAIEYFNRAIEEDPAYAADYTGRRRYLLLGESGLHPIADAFHKARKANAAQALGVCRR